MHKGGVLLRKEIVAAVQNSGWNNAFIFVSLRRTKVCTPRAGGASKGKPVKVRNCARSCELLNGPAVLCHWTDSRTGMTSEKAPRREQSEDLPCQV